MTRIDPEIVAVWDEYESRAQRRGSDPVKLMHAELARYCLADHPALLRHPLDPNSGLPTSRLGALLAICAVRQVGYLAGFAAPPQRTHKRDGNAAS